MTNDNSGSGVPAFIPKLGLGYDSIFQEERARLLINDSEKEDLRSLGFPDKFDLKFASNQIDFSKLTKKTITAKGSVGAYSANLSSTSEDFFSSNSYSCYLIGYAFRGHQRFTVDDRRQNIDQYAQRILDEKNADDIERIFGDRYIHSVESGWELYVKIEIQTSSQTNRKTVIQEIGGGFASVADASAKIERTRTKTNAMKNVTYSIHGDIAPGFEASTEIGAIEKLLKDFWAPEVKVAPRERYFWTKPIEHLHPLLGEKIVDRKEIRAREQFVTLIDSSLQYLDLWTDDCRYVLSEANVREFEANEINRASTDLKMIEKTSKDLNDARQDALDHWKDNGNNGDFFGNDLPVEVMEYQPYARKAEPPSDPKPRPARKKKPHPDRGHVGDKAIEHGKLRLR